MFRLIYQLTLSQITAFCNGCSALLIFSFIASYHLAGVGLAEQNTLLVCSAMMLFISQCCGVLMVHFGNPTLIQLLKRV
ncbi:hypothetical protein [Planctobacterium marinum]|uniref:Uncharacterized protein n=1 Tax=Planctobacterium marinum TaxID=1631968 RepID=A0AA48I1R1_9ALTE|nr:hypothetical protein MACH26_41860 [Planctobacterium marinum]